MKSLFFYPLIGLNLVIGIQIIDKLNRSNNHEKKVIELRNKYTKIMDEYDKLSNKKKYTELSNEMDRISIKNKILLDENSQFLNWYIQIGGK